MQKDGSSQPKSKSTQTPRRLGARIGLFYSIVVLLIQLDWIFKRLIIQTGFAEGSLIAGPILGLFDITVVHNTGAAWGLFENSSIALAVFSLVICIVLLICAFTVFKQSTILVHIGLALVVGGGMGNLIDRFAYGYVIDFIETTFISFPVFNLADIGVTCGFLIFLLGMVLDICAEKRAGASLFALPEDQEESAISESVNIQDIPLSGGERH